MTTPHPTHVTIGVIPDNIRVDGDLVRLRLCLSLTPTSNPRPGDLEIADIAKWPTQIAKATQNLQGKENVLRIAVGKLSKTGDKYAVGNVRVLDTPFGQDAASKYVVDAQKLWEKIFEPKGINPGDGFDALDRGLRGKQTATQQLFDASAGQVRFGTTDLERIAPTVDVFYTYPTARSLLRNAAQQAMKLENPNLSAADDLLDPDLTIRQWETAHTYFLSLVFENDLRGDLLVDKGNLANGKIREAVIREMTAAGLRISGPMSAAVFDAQEDDIAQRRRDTDEEVATFREIFLGGVSKSLRPPDSADPIPDLLKLRKELARFGVLSRPSENTACPGLSPEDAALRKLSGILSYPTLAKFLGFVIDVEVSAADLLQNFAADGTTKRLSGAVAAFVEKKIDDADPDPAMLLWSAFTCRGKADGNVGTPFIPAYFGPCPGGQLDDVVDKGDVLKDGVFDLTIRQRKAAEKRRFALETVDTEKTLAALASHARSMIYSDREGVYERDQTRAAPEIKARGIQLRDLEVEFSVAADAQRELGERASAATTELAVRFAEHWLVGYGFDCAVVGRRRKPDGGWEWDDWTRIDQPAHVRWRPLVARTLEFPSLPQKFVHDVERFRHRDDGHVRVSASEKQSTLMGVRGTNVEVQETLFSWVGEGLGVPPTAEKPVEDGQSCDTVWPDALQDLAVDLVFDLPKSDLRLAPPLREGYGYLVGARAYYVNGCGLTSAEALPRFAEKNRKFRVILGEPATDGNEPDTPFVFKRHERIKPPTVLLPWNDRLVTAPENQVPKGESIDTLVIRSAPEVTRTARRFLVPPQATFTSGEQAGVFDKVTRPIGAYVRNVRAQLDKKDGSFPIARGGKAARFQARDDSNNNNKSRGSVLVLDPNANPPDVHHYPDPWARRLLAEFRLHGENSSSGALPAPISFWPKPSSFVEAVPVLIELKRGSRGDPRFRFDLSDATANVDTISPGTRYRVKKLSVVLAPGEQVRLRVWSVPDPEQVLNDHGMLAPAIRLLADIDPPLDEAELEGTAFTTTVINRVRQSFEKMGMNLVLKPQDVAADIEALLIQAPIANVQTETFLDLVHAVDKPLENPAFVPYSGDENQKIQLRAVVITGAGGAGNSADPLLAAWKEYVAKQTLKDPNPMNWPSEQNGTDAFFVGRVKIHRPSTGKLRCQFNTVEYGPRTVKLIDGKYRINERPQSWGKSFHIEDVVLSEPLYDKEVDLLYSDAPVHPDEGRKARPDIVQPNPLRGLSAPVGDGKAHRLMPRLIATSRFTEYLPDPLESKTGVGQYEEASDRAPDIWIPATSRPSRVALDRIIPIFRWYDESRSNDEITFERKISLRIFVNSDPSRPDEYWWSTGEGEMLGIVCWPANLMSSKPYDAQCVDEAERVNFDRFEAAVGEARGYVTRWGADPISLSGAPDDIISADRFAIMPPDRFTAVSRRADRVRLPVRNTGVPPAPGSGDQPECIVEQGRDDNFLVSVAAYDPKVDEHNGEIYFDIAIDPGAAHQPFVQLGLARYQPNAVAELELSEPTTHWCNLMPERAGKVMFKNDREFVLQVHGVGFHQRDLGPGHDGVRHLSDRPLLNVRLMRAVSPNAMGKGEKIEWLPVVDGHGNPIEWLQISSHARGAEMWWWLSIKLPHARNERQYGLLVEEVELMTADNVPAGGWERPEDINFTTVVTERGPLFSHIIRLWR